jgi:hypothetical protein
MGMPTTINRRIGDGDVYDAHHYASGSYTDVIITNDRGFIETCSAIPGAVRTMTFEDFLASYLEVTKPT